MEARARKGIHCYLGCRLTIGDAKALAESKGVTIAVADRLLNERIHSAEILEVRGEGATLRVPLDGSMAALGRLETCFEKNSRQGSETNPFVAPNRKP